MLLVIFSGYLTGNSTCLLSCKFESCKGTLQSTYCIHADVAEKQPLARPFLAQGFEYRNCGVSQIVHDTPKRNHQNETTKDAIFVFPLTARDGKSPHPQTPFPPPPLKSEPGYIPSYQSRRILTQNPWPESKVAA